jgi:hypothetical protein
LREEIVTSVRTDERRQEVQAMGQTIAEALREEGRKEGLQQGEVRSRQQILLRLLRGRFGRVPRATERVILATEDLGRLDQWLDRVLASETLQDLQIRVQS